MESKDEKWRMNLNIPLTPITRRDENYFELEEALVSYILEEIRNSVKEALEKKDQQMREIIESCPETEPEVYITGGVKQSLTGIREWKQEQLKKLNEKTI